MNTRRSFAALATLSFALAASYMASPAQADNAAPAANSAPASSTPVQEDYTGIVIDARHLPDILRSPAPAIYGPGPDFPLLYPDRSDVPTPDEVQDESVVRYYRVEADAEQGVGGKHPLILKAEAVVTCGHDALRLTAADMTRLQDLDKTLHFSRTWKVGFLVPADK